jgi:hypothetical protein
MLGYVHVHVNYHYHEATPATIGVEKSSRCGFGDRYKHNNMIITSIVERKNKTFFSQTLDFYATKTLENL